MTKRGNNEDRFETTALVLGFVIGLVIGGIGARFNASRYFQNRRSQLEETGQRLRGKLEAAVLSDSVAVSLAEGKAAAQRRRAQLGLGR